MHGRPVLARRLLFLMPHALHHELEERRLEPPLRALGLVRGVAPAAACPAGRELVRLHPRQDLVHERVLDAGRWGEVELIPDPEWPPDGLLGCGLVQTLDLDAVGEELRHPGRQPVEARDGVVAHGDQEVDRQGGVGDRLAQGGGQRPLVLRTAVDEVLLELVEDDQEFRLRPLRPLPQPLDGRTGVRRWLGRLGTEEVRDRRPDCRPEPGKGLDPGTVEEGDHVARPAELRQVAVRVLPQPAGDPGLEQRRLARPARSKHEGESRGEQVRDDDVSIGLPAEEERLVYLVEGLEALVRLGALTRADVLLGAGPRGTHRSTSARGPTSGPKRPSISAAIAVT